MSSTNLFLDSIEFWAGLATVVYLLGLELNFERHEKGLGDEQD